MSIEQTQVSSPGKRGLFKTILVLIPVMAVLLIELVLRIAGYGPDLDLWIPYANRAGYVTVNPQVALRYFPTVDITSFGSFDALAVDKPAGTKRIFILGGSTAAGFPYYGNGSFPRYLDLWLQALYPEAEVEVINLGMTAVNSFTVREFARECLRMEPDMLIIYAGHNEFYGALGTGSALRNQISGRRSLTLFMQKIKHWKLYQVMADLTGLASGSKITISSDKTLMARMAADPQIPYGNSTYQRTTEYFEANIDDILRWYQKAGVPVLLGKLVANLRNQAPFVSDPVTAGPQKDLNGISESIKQGDNPGVIRSLQTMLNRNPQNADLHFQLAQCYYQLAQYDSALIHFRLARDFDGLRFRASEDINRTIDRLAADYASCLTVKIDSVFAGSSPGGIPGKELFLEHLHPNVKGYEMMAQAFAEEITAGDLLNLGVINPAVVRAVGSDQINHLTALDEQIAEYQIDILLSGWPFRTAGRTKSIADLNPGTEVEKIAVDFLAHRINDWQAHVSMVYYYRERQEHSSAVEEGRWLTTAYPDNWKSHKLLAELYLEAGKIESALSVLLQVIELVDDQFCYLETGKIYMERREAKRALYYLEKANAMAPYHPEGLYHLGGAYLMTGNRSAAIEILEKLVRTAPNYPNGQQLLMRIKTIN